MELRGTLYRPVKFFSALPYNEKRYTGSEGKNSKRLSLRNIDFFEGSVNFQQTARGLLVSLIYLSSLIVSSASFPTTK